MVILSPSMVYALYIYIYIEREREIVFTTEIFLVVGLRSDVKLSKMFKQNGLFPVP